MSEFVVLFILIFMFIVPMIGVGVKCVLEDEGISVGDLLNSGQKYQIRK